MVLPGQDGLQEKKNSIHPRPQLTRARWIDLGGAWGFAYDDERREVLMSPGKRVQMSTRAPFRSPFHLKRLQVALAIPAFIPSYGIDARFKFPP